MALIMSWQFRGWPASWSTLAAASKALSLPALTASSEVFGAAALVGPVFLAFGFLVRCATPAGALRLVQRSWPPVGASAPAAALAAFGAAGTSLTSVAWVVLDLLLAISDLLNGLVMRPRRPL